MIVNLSSNTVDNEHAAENISYFHEKASGEVSEARSEFNTTENIAYFLEIDSEEIPKALSTENIASILEKDSVKGDEKRSRPRKRRSTSELNKNESEFSTNFRKRLCVKVASSDVAIDNVVNTLSPTIQCAKLFSETPLSEEQPYNLRMRRSSENRSTSFDLQSNNDDESMVTEEQSSNLHSHHLSENEIDSSSNSGSDVVVVFELSPKKDNKQESSRSPRKLSSSKHKVENMENCKVLLNSFAFKVWFDKHKFFVVNDEDLRSLSNTHWLTGNIINFYLQYVIKKSTYQRRTHLFSTDFYDYLLRKEKLDSASNSSVQSVTKSKAVVDRQPWTKDVDIYSKDFIIMPANIGGHWILIIIAFLKQLTSRTNSKEAAEKIPRIFVYDSLKSDNSESITRIKAFLEEELKKQGKSFDEKNLPLGPGNRDKQLDSHSCGLYVYHFLEIFFKKKMFESNEELTIDEHFDPALKRKEVLEFIMKATKTIIGF